VYAKGLTVLKIRELQPHGRWANNKVEKYNLEEDIVTVYLFCINFGNVMYVCVCACLHAHACVCVGA
jgi:hypothetical protein